MKSEVGSPIISLYSHLLAFKIPLSKRKGSRIWWQRGQQTVERARGDVGELGSLGNKGVSVDKGIKETQIGPRERSR